MQSPGISDISKRLSSLRMNNSGTRINSQTYEINTFVPLPTSCDESPKYVRDSTDSDSIESEKFTEANEHKTLNFQEVFDPMDPDSFPSYLLSPGIDMIRVTRRKRIRRLFQLHIPSLTLTWNNKVDSKVEMDKIQSIRVGDEAKNYREEFNVSSEFNNLWITVIYISSNSSNSSSNLSNDLKALHMIAPTKQNYDIMLKTLKLLSKWSKDQESLMNCANINEFSKIKWNKKMKKSDRKVLSFEEVLKLTSELHIFMDISYLRFFFDQCDNDKTNALNFNQFQNFVSKLKERTELNTIFDDLNIKDGKMDESSFKYFIEKVQHENDYDEMLIHNLFIKFSHNNEGIYMTPSNLTNYLHSSYTKPLINEEEFDSDYYSYPLTDYFISSSHNTYLLGKQFHGLSSIEGYIHALQRGCRCIEIDIWDGNLTNSKEQYPIVTHGRTLTNSIDFKLVVDVIRKYAFIATPYPLIISLEIRCSKESQLKCISIMKLIFGDMMIVNPINKDNILPSPKDLKHKILIKVKKSNFTTIIKPLQNSSTISSYSNHSSLSTSSTQSDDLYYSGSKTDETINTDDGDSNNTNNSNSIPSTISSKALKTMVSRPTTKTPILPELTLLAPYLVGIKYRNFSLPESKTFNHVLSFSDRSLMLLLKDKTKLISILKHNRRGIMRVYPSVVRFRSDNFNPIKFWELGCQLVATNWQIWDRGEELCESFFASVGSGIGYSGYRLKPKTLRTIDIDSSNLDKEKIKIQNLNSLAFTNEKYLDISIISGQQLPKPKDIGNTISNGFTPWVEIEIYNVKPLHGEIIHMNKEKTETIDGVFAESKFEKKEIGNNDAKNIGTVKINHVDQTSANPHSDVIFKTRLAENPDNAFSPKWNTSCRLQYLSNENELSFIRIVVKTNRTNKSKASVIGKVSNVVVKSSNNEVVIGSWCCKIGDLKQGYRHIRLGDSKGEELIYSSLFIRVRK